MRFVRTSKQTAIIFQYNINWLIFMTEKESVYCAVRDECLTFWHRSFTFNWNKSSTWCNNISVYYPDVCLQLNMFRVFSRPSSGAQWLQWQPLVLPSYRGDRLSWFGHVQRMPDTRTVKKIFNWKPLTKISQERPKYRWEDNITQDICQIKIKNWKACIQDRGK